MRGNGQRWFGCAVGRNAEKMLLLVRIPRCWRSKRKKSLMSLDPDGRSRGGFFSDFEHLLHLSLVGTKVT